MATNKFSERVWANVALIAALATVLIAALRVYVWSGYLTPVALSVLSVADRATLLGSSLLLVVLALTPLLMSEVLFSAHFRPRKLLDPETSPLDAFRIYSYVAVAFVALTGFLPLTVTLGVGILCALVAVIWAIVVVVYRVRSGPEAARKVARTELFSNTKFRPTAGLVLLSCGLLVTTMTQAWLPLETILRTGSSEATVGYVVGESGTFTLILSETKQPMWSQTEEIEARVVCTRNPGDFWGRSFFAAVNRVQLPECGDTRNG